MTEWPKVSLAGISKKPTYGAIAKGTADKVGPLFVRQTDIVAGRIDWSTVPHCDLPPEKAMRYELALGDLLISRLGNGVGNAVTVSETRPGAIYAGYLVRFQVDHQVADSRFVGYQLQSQAWRNHVLSFRSGAAQPTLNARQMGHFEFRLPPLSEQRAIAATLGALDDKIDSNQRQRALLRELGRAWYCLAILGESRSVLLSELATSIARGVAPKYADDDKSAPLVINQKCIRDGWVFLQPARRMVDRKVKPEKQANGGDILVNSTGTGTLGRLARWHSGDVFVDGHVSVIKPDAAAIPPTVLAYSLLNREPDIEDLATGSTGQTELSASRLAELPVEVPTTSTARALESDFVALEDRCHQLADEMQSLSALRDTLLPELLAGRIRVPVEEAMI